MAHPTARGGALAGRELWGRCRSLLYDAPRTACGSQDPPEVGMLLVAGGGRDLMTRPSPPTLI